MKALGIEFGIKDIKDIFQLIKMLFKRKSKFNKSNSYIVFIDDEDFPVVDNLRQSGWSVEKLDDVFNIECEQVKRAQIIFIDNKGVGKVLSESDEGIGIAKLIKKFYGYNKRVILYSGHSVLLGEYLNIIDNQLPKNSDTYEFEQMIHSELEKLK
jgi:hypothetical protein